jgi:hypothetical protein
MMAYGRVPRFRNVVILWLAIAAGLIVLFDLMRHHA